MQKLIVTAALTGGATVPTQSKYLPITPDEIADEAIRCAEAGAAVVHIHARDPKNGRPSSDQAVFGEIVSKIKSRSDVVICITTGGGVGIPIEERVKVIPNFQPELASFNVGSLNFSLHPVAEYYEPEDYRFDWEEQFLKMSKNYIFPNTFRDMEAFVTEMKKYGTKPEHEAYDVGHLYNLAYLVKRGLTDPKPYIQFVTGVLGGIGSAPEDVIMMKQTCDRLFGADGYQWSVIGVGYPHQFTAGTLSVMMGGHVRVGLEDNLFVRRRVLAKSNAELVTKIIRIASEFEREPATPDEARAILGLKGGDKVAF